VDIDAGRWIKPYHFWPVTRIFQNEGCWDNPFFQDVLIMIDVPKKMVEGSDALDDASL